MKLRIAVALLIAACPMTTAFPTHAASGALMADRIIVNANSSHDE
jgi:hypothetical protein